MYLTWVSTPRQCPDRTRTLLHGRQSLLILPECRVLRYFLVTLAFLQFVSHHCPSVEDYPSQLLVYGNHLGLDQPFRKSLPACLGGFNGPHL